MTDLVPVEYNRVRIHRVVAGDESSVTSLGVVKLPSVVLDNGVAVTNRVGLNRFLGRSDRYHPWAGDDAEDQSWVHGIVAKVFHPFLSDETLRLQTYWYTPVHGGPAIDGLPVDIITCLVRDLLAADAAGATHKSHKPMIRQIQQLVVSVFGRSITEMVYEATGYKEHLLRGQSAQYLPDTTVAEPCTWDSIFPVDFWRNLDRLYGDVAAEKYGPREVKRVYETLGAGTYVRLQQRRDAHEGTRGRLHQYLTLENRELLRRRVQRCVELLSVSQTLGDYEAFFFMEFGKMNKRLLAPVAI